MILEIEEESRDFITTNRKDYCWRKLGRLPAYYPRPCVPAHLDIINASHHDHLHTKKKNDRLPPSLRSEKPQEFLDKIRDKFVDLRKALPETVEDENLIDCEYKKNKVTLYQHDYTKDICDLPLTKEKEYVSLPEDWVISETILTQSYKNPWKILSENFLKVQRGKKPPNSLDPNPKQREILRVTTGNSEYGRTIAKTGAKILREHPFGPPLPVEPIRIKQHAGYSTKCLERGEYAVPSGVF